ncbi:MAG: Lrp/AsnC family transcriptional regulator, partial [Pseudomonadota bacterium]
RRIKQLENDQVIESKVALVNAEALELGLLVFVMIRALGHEPGWLAKFKSAVATMPEIIGAHRMSGDLDYVLRVRVRDVKSYDNFYQRLIAKVPIADLSASFVMEDIKDTTALPL